MANVTQILFFGGEILGLPIPLIIIIVLWVLCKSFELTTKAREAAAEFWKDIDLGLTRKHVVDKLGRPKEVVPGVPEKWVYEFTHKWKKQDVTLTGYVILENDVVVGYKVPE